MPANKPHALPRHWSIRVYGIPKGQPRTKAFRRAAHAGVYTPSTADAWKLAVVAAWRELVARCEEYGNPPEALAGPLALELVVLMPRPARLRTKKSPDGRVPHVGVPDADNLAKAAMDALTMAGAWVDDAQVVRLVVTKSYASKVEAPGAAITLAEEAA